MTFDTTSIIACIIIVMLVAMSVCANPFFRRIKKADGTADTGMLSDDKLPKLSVIVLANNDAEGLEAHLPIVLTQDYASGYEVIVVGESGDMPTEIVLKHFAKCPILYTTNIPHHSLFISKSKLAVALGVKAAHNEWIVLIDSSCRPQSDNWLKTLAKNMDDGANIVLGYSNYNTETNHFYRFVRLHTECYLLRQAERGTAYRCGGTNIAFRRSEFIAQDGYRGNLQFVNGEYDFIINKYARRHSARITTDEQAWVLEDKPTHKEWHNRNISYAHIRQYLNHSLATRMLFNCDMALMYINYVFLTACIALSAYSSKWLIVSAGALGFLATITIRLVLAQKAYNKFDVNIPVWKTIFFELAIVWHNIATRIRYSRTDKYDFTTHKL